MTLPVTASGGTMKLGALEDLSSSARDEVALSYIVGEFEGRVVEGAGLTATPYAAIVIAVLALGVTLLIGKSQTLRDAETVAPSA